jgi:hypothetical protein
LRFRAPFHRAIQVLAAVILATLAVVVPAGAAHANDPGTKVTLFTSHNVGIYTQPQVGAKNPIAIDLVPGNAIYASCWTYGQSVAGDANYTWYAISGEQTSGGFNHSWAGWAYADYVDEQHAEYPGGAGVPFCASITDPGNGVPIRASAGHNLGLYSCPAASSGYCMGKKNGPDLSAGSTVLVTCYQLGEPISGQGNTWFHVAAESTGAHYSAWVLAGYLDNGVKPAGLAHCPSKDGTY